MQYLAKHQVMLPVQLYGIIFFVLFLFCHKDTYAALNIGYRLEIELQSIREELLVLITFSGPGLELGIDAIWSGQVGTVSANFETGMSYIANRFNHGGAHFPLGLNIALIRTISNLSSSNVIRIVLPLAFTMNNSYLFSWDDAHLYWLTAH